MGDDLTTPVRRKTHPERWRWCFSVLATMLGLAFLGALLYVLMVDDPLGGEPSAVVRLEPTMPAEGRRAEEAAEIRRSISADEPVEDPVPDLAEAPGDIVVSEPGGAPYQASALVPSLMLNPALAEQSRYGLLPVAGPDGQRPADAYSQPSSAPAARPRIAVILGGMGLSTTATERAIDLLPGEVALAFAPYGREVERLAVRARQDGHEIMLQVPLEPYDYPDNDPGPHTLLTGLSEAQNRDRLHWVMSRFTGYVGVTNYMGARFSAAERTVRPFLGELRQRGLIYVDDGASSRSVARQVAQDVGIPFTIADIGLDVVPTRQAIAEALGRLEDLALERGLAVGAASGLPVAIEEIAEWSRTLDAKGISLVPITSAVSGGET